MYPFTGDLSLVRDGWYIPGFSHEIGREPIRAEERNPSYRLLRFEPTTWTGFVDLLFGSEHRFPGTAQMKSVTDFYGPELIRTSGPILASIDGMEAVPPALGELYFIHGITPETETSTHYYGVITRNFRLNDEALDGMLLEMDRSVRQQDVDAIEAVERRVDQGGLPARAAGALGRAGL